MAEYLVIRFGSNPEQAAHWIVVDGNGTRRSPPVTGPLAEAAKDVGEKSVIVLVPAETVLTTSVDLPIKSGPRLRSALPFALEEQLAEDVENLHFAAGGRGDNGLLRVSVVAHDQMREWIGLLESAGINATQIIPENHGLAKIPGTMSLLVTEDQVMFNDGAESEFVMQGVKPSDAIAVTGALDAVTVAAKRGINLLQGLYGAKVEYGPLLRPWRYAAALLLALVVTGFVSKALDYYRLAAEQDALREQFTQTYREIRPGDTSEITDPARHVDAIRRSLGGTVSTEIFLPSLQQLSIALQQNTSAEIEAISYRAGIIDVRLTAPDVATLDNIQKIVATSGRFTASIQSTDQVGDKVSSRIQIRESGV
jgi:general secretion pathway protein L